MAILEARHLIKTFTSGPVVTPVLKGIDLAFERGEFVAIMGRTGAGKSTLMYQLSLLDDPTSGEILIDGKEAHALSEREKMLMRLFKFGYVFQDYALMPELTAIENVALPLLMERVGLAEATHNAETALSKVGLAHGLGNLPSELSGGEQQRVSIARAIAERPEILFADEPTANLDRESAAAVMDIFKELHAAGQTILMVTHEEEYGRIAERMIVIDDGRVISDSPTNPRSRLTP
jgi:putative ABC transport system ATP-binding protein